jgi:hypothetical protein
MAEAGAPTANGQWPQAVSVMLLLVVTIKLLILIAATFYI